MHDAPGGEGVAHQMDLGELAPELDGQTVIRHPGACRHHGNLVQATLPAREGVCHDRTTVLEPHQPVEHVDTHPLAQQALQECKAGAVLGATGEVEPLGDELDRAAPISQELGDRRRPEVIVHAADDQHALVADGALEHVEGIEHRLCIDPRHLEGRRSGAGRDHDRVGAELDHLLRGHRVAEHELDAQMSKLPLEEGCLVSEVAAVADRAPGRQGSRRSSGEFREEHSVATERSDTSGLEARGTGPDHHHRLWLRGQRRLPSLTLGPLRR